MALSILAVGAHPDDLEILCAGTLARCAKRGDRVVMAHLCAGDMGHFRIPPKKLAGLRRKEAQAAGRLIGAEVLTTGIPDATLVNDDATRRKVMDLVRAAKPDLVITHHTDDYMGDHVACSKLVTDASFHASLPHFRTRRPPHKKIPPVYFMDTIAGLQCQPSVYVDITETFATKRRMLARHRTQMDWLSHHDAVNMLEAIEVAARFRGLQCGKRYAEGFVPYQVWGRTTTERLLP